MTFLLIGLLLRAPEPVSYTGPAVEAEEYDDGAQFLVKDWDHEA